MLSPFFYATAPLVVPFNLLAEKPSERARNGAEISPSIRRFFLHFHEGLSMAERFVMAVEAIDSNYYINCQRMPAQREALHFQFITSRHYII
jgi:hypothetical protein